MKKKPEILRAICDSIADGVKPLDAALLENISARAFFLWLRQSKEKSDPGLVIDWLGEQTQFASAVAAARDIAASGKRPPSASGANIVHHYHHFIFETASAVADVASSKTAHPEPVRDAELDEMLGPEPVRDVPVSEPPDATVSEPLLPEPEAAPVIPDKRAEPVRIDETPSRQPRNALERDLFARLAAARHKNAPGPGKG